MSTHEDRTVAMPVTRPDGTVDRPLEGTIDGDQRLADEWATDDRQPGERATDEGMPPGGAVATAVTGDRTDDRADDLSDHRAGEPGLQEQAPFDDRRDRLGGTDGHDEAGWRSEITGAHAATPTSAGAEVDAADDEWRRLAGDFVDDPRHAVEEGRRLVQQAVDAMMAKAGIGPDGVAGDGQGDTEQMRQAFRRLRDLHRSVSGI